MDAVDAKAGSDMSELPHPLRWIARRLHIPVAVLLGTIAALLVLELALRARMPHLAQVPQIDEVLFLTPDRVVGWKHPTNFQYLWAGRNPYCVEFRAAVSTNSFGFRDREWTIAKPKDTIRIAVIGDSFVEALQVPLEDTVPRQLEARLAPRLPDRKIETLNFGVSNYSVGQYLLVYDEYVRQFQPDYVVMVVAYLNFMRTTQPELSSWLQDVYSLQIRPSFALDPAGNLTYVPAADYDRYERDVLALLEREYGSDRARPARRIPVPFVLANYTLHVLSRNIHPTAILQRRRLSEFPDASLNYRIIDELHRRVKEAGATLVFADAFEYLDGYDGVSGSTALIPRNRALIQKLGAGYVDLSPALRQAPSSPQYACDLHFNVTGNHIIAETLTGWFERALPSRGRPQ
jgi:hypothetical protein